MTMNANFSRRRFHVSLAFAALLTLGACAAQAAPGDATATAPAQTSGTQSALLEQAKQAGASVTAACKTNPGGADCLAKMKAYTDLVLGASPNKNEPAQISGAAVADTPVTIIRESVYANPKKFITHIRNSIAYCRKVQATLGLSSSAAPDLTDEQILQLLAARTEERFSEGRYSQDKRDNEIDLTNLDPQKSCTLKALHFRTLRIKPDRCNQIDIDYDLDKGTGNREESHGICMPQRKRTASAQGEVVQLNDGQTCRWNAPKGSLVALWRVCLLEPMHYDGYGREMVVQSEFNQQLAQPVTWQVTAVMPDPTAMYQIEKLVRLDVGSPIPPSFFQAPADSNNFPRKVVGK